MLKTRQDFRVSVGEAFEALTYPFDTYSLYLHKYIENVSSKAYKIEGTNLAIFTNETEDMAELLKRYKHKLNAE
jgi:hypothetical protein